MISLSTPCFLSAVLVLGAGCGMTREQTAAHVDGDGDAGVDASLPADGGAPDGDTRRRAEDATRLGCSPACKAVYAFPVDPARHCVDASTRTAVACTCDALEGAPGPCRRRIADGTEWAFYSVSLEDEASWEQCPAVDWETNMHSCDFATCAEPPRSTCGRDDTCAQKGCDTPEYDAQGCFRTTCTTDAQCTSGDRCVYIGCGDTFSCVYSSALTCGCGGPLPCIFSFRCNSIAKYGPGGDWVALEFQRTTGPCPANDGSCLTTWRVTPDGTVAISRGGVPQGDKVLGDPQPLQQLVAGEDLRPALRDGIACDPSPTDIGIVLRLELSDQTLERDATGCILVGPTDNVFQQAFDWVKNL